MALFSLSAPAPSLMAEAPLVSWVMAPVSWSIPLVMPSSSLISIMESMLYGTAAMVKPPISKSVTSAVKPTSPSPPGRTTKVMVLSLPALATVPLRVLMFSHSEASSVTEICSM